MWSWSFGRVAGIDLKVHASFVLVLVLGAAQWGSFGASGAVFGAVLTLLVFGSVLLHELGHSLVALAFDIPVKDITLYPIGGVARLGARPKTPGQEFLIAVAGPAVNVVLVFLIGALGVWWFGLDALESSLDLTREPSAVTLTTQLIASNAVLAIFNMIPALPMDGGRVLRAVLSSLMGPAKATRISAWIARVLAVGLFSAGVVFGKPLLSVIAVMVFLGAGQEVREQQFAHVLDAIEVGDAINPYAPRLTPATTLADAVAVLTMTHWDAFAVEQHGRIIGAATRKAILEAATREGAYGYVSGIVERNVPSIAPNERLEAARVVMSSRGVPYVAVVRDGTFLGLLTEADLLLIADRLMRGKRWGEEAAGARWSRTPSSRS